MDASERFCNRLGRKRVYARKSCDKNAYAELNYVEPALDFDETTGMPIISASAPSRHLMIASFGRMAAAKEDVLQIVRACFRWYRWPREAFRSDEAYRGHCEYLHDLEARFKKQLDVL